jgi:hypothetical protein|tara:strand:+ start:37795 stop:38430 length:636 start_codon:yes stop_codon:yes gene_type:complete
MAIVGYNATLKVTGTPTGLSSEAMSTVSAVANTYQVTDAAKRILDRAATLTFTEGSTAGRVSIAAAQITSIDYLFGRVTFSSTQAEPVRVVGNYLPAAVVAGAHAFSMDLSREVLDDTDFTSTGWRSRKSGLMDAAISVTRWDSVDKVYLNLIQAGTPVVMEIKPLGTTAAMLRGFFVPESENKSGDVGGLESAELSYLLDGSTLSAFSWP